MLRDCWLWRDQQELDHCCDKNLSLDCKEEQQDVVPAILHIVHIYPFLCVSRHSQLLAHMEN